MKEKNIDIVVLEFIENMDSLNASCPLVMSVVTNMASKMTTAHREYLEKYGELTNQNEDGKVYSIPIERQGQVRRLREQSDSLRKSITLIPRNFLVSFVSEFDCFLGSLLKVIYNKKPELLNDSSRQITYSDLLTFFSLEDAKEQVLEKEIETILRKSHAEHFSTLENKFDLKLRKGLDIWSEFIEITERRNLFVHANGIVSSQYLKVCAQHGFDVGDLKVGDRLVVDADYLKRSYQIIYEISVKLAHVLWRKLFPDDRENADNNLNNICFRLVLKNQNLLASEILEFAVSLPKHHNDTIKRMMIINLAQAYKRSDREAKCREVLKRFDWSATGYEFKLAVSVLNEDYEQSSKYLKTVVTAGDLSEEQVIEWPLFKEFRESEEFSVIFKELFNKDYAEQEGIIKEDFQNHMDSVFSNTEESKSVEEVAEEIEKELETADA